MKSGKWPGNMGQRAREERKGIKTEQPHSQEQASLGVMGCGSMGNVQWWRQNRDIQKICMPHSRGSPRNGRATPLECRPRGAESRLQEIEEELYFSTTLSRNMA